ncbi:MAG: trypsin-like peptidase domain-containing protein [Oscillospiraceae bacterium]|nr:trypsin-like peptidase domain-containing protein [Oscillospiraceae bacterium]
MNNFDENNPINGEQTPAPESQAVPVNDGQDVAPESQASPVNGGQDVAPESQAAPVNDGQDVAPENQAAPVNDGQDVAPQNQGNPFAEEKPVLGQYASAQNVPPYGVPPQNTGMPGGVPYGQYPPPYANGQMYGAYPPPPVPPVAPKKKRFSLGCLWAIIGTVAVMIVIIMVLAVLIAGKSGKQDGKNDKTDTTSIFGDNLQTQEAERVVIELPTVEKPVLKEELYQNKETGLLTAAGVAEMILPSQVRIQIFGDVPYAPLSSGSGVILTADGYILTNAHVVDGAVKVTADFYDGSCEEAVIVGIDKKSDLAVIKVGREDLTPAEIGKSSSLVIGEEVALAGAGGGFVNTVTYGHVTGLDREINTDYITSSEINCIQTDAALNFGNSGGALVNMYGQVVGVPVALMNHERYENIGFCIAIDDAVPIAEELIAKGYVSKRARIGITYIPIGDAAASEYGIKAGLCVMEIDPTCNAAYSGIMPYDIITHLDGVRTYGADEIFGVLADKRPGDTITVTVYRKTVTNEISEFDVQVMLEQDVSTVSGYDSSATHDDYIGRDIIK